MMVRAANEPLQCRPDTLDMIGRSKRELAVVAHFMPVAKEGIDPLVATGTVCSHGAARMNVFQEKAIRRVLFAVRDGTQNHRSSVSFIGS